jgi:hypothetical protein
VACPGGAFCPGGARIWPQAGYWSAGESSGTVSLCEPRERCLGGSASRCAPGYEGAYCGRCAPGFRMERDTCVECGSGSAYGQRMYYVIVIGTIVAAVLLLHDRILTTILSAIMTMQVLAAVGKMATSEMPSFVRAFYGYLSVLNLDFEGLQPGCDGLPEETFVALYFGNIAFVICIWIVMAMGLGVLWLAIPRRRRFYRNRLFSSALLVVAVFYYILSARSLEAITCYMVDGEYRLQSDLTMVCWEGPHIKLAAAGCFALLVCSLGFPWWVANRLGRHEPLLYSDKRIRARYGMLYDSFKPSHFMFGVAALFVDLLLAVAGVVFRYNPIVQVSMVVGVLLIYSVMLLCQRPFRHAIETTAAFFAFLVATAGAALNFIGVAAARDDEGLNEIRSVADTLDVGTDGTPQKDTGAFAIIAYVVVALTSLVLLCFLYLLVRQVVVAIVHKRKGREGSAYYDGEEGWHDDDDDSDAIPPESRARIAEELGVFTRVGSEGTASVAGTLSRANSQADLISSGAFEDMSVGGGGVLSRENSSTGLHRVTSTSSLTGAGAPVAATRSGSGRMPRLARDSSTGNLVGGNTSANANSNATLISPRQSPTTTRLQARRSGIAVPQNQKGSPGNRVKPGTAI